MATSTSVTDDLPPTARRPVADKEHMIVVQPLKRSEMQVSSPRKIISFCSYYFSR